MRQVIVYVEGYSDKLAMESLLGELIEERAMAGYEIQFIAIKGKGSQRGGDAKRDLLLKAPGKAANMLCNNPHTIVVLIPDLYPKNKGFSHETFEDLERGIVQEFEQNLKKRKIDDDRLRDRFKVFCFKYDLEALILAAESALVDRLGIPNKKNFKVNWCKPVEDQNHDRPPKKVVGDLFQKYLNRSYKETSDAAAILEQVCYQDIAEACPQCFAPFVRFLENLSDREEKIVRSSEQ